MKWALLAVFAVCQVVLVWLELQLDPGIIPFELAATPERARAILEAWGPEGRRLALIAHAVDYGYLVAYGLGLAIVARRFDPRLAPLPIAAAACDAIENAWLVVVLLSGPTLVATAAAALFAAIKFGLLALLALGLVRARTGAA